MDTEMQVTVGLAFVNILLLFLIIGTNIQSYRKMRAEYTLFSIIFALMFLLQYVVGAYLYFTNMDVYHPSIAVHMLILTGIQTIAFGYLLYMLRQ